MRAVDGQQLLEIDALRRVWLIVQSSELDCRCLIEIREFFAPEFLGLDVGDRHEPCEMLIS